MDAFEAAKINEDREPVLEARAREKERAEMRDRIAAVHKLPATSPFAELEEGLIDELCKRKGLVDAPGWSDRERRIALHLLYEDEVKTQTPAPPPTPEVAQAMPRQVPLPRARVPVAKPVKVQSVDDLPASANGCYVVTKGGKCAFGGSLQNLKEGKVISRSYSKADLQSILNFGLELAPQEPMDAPWAERLPTWEVDVGDTATAKAFVVITVAVPPGLDPADLAGWAQQVLGGAVRPEEPSVLRQVEAELAAEEARAAAAREVEDRARAEEAAAEERAATALLAAAEEADLKAAEAAAEESPVEPDEPETEEQAARSRANAETDPQTPQGKRRNRKG